MNRDKIILSLFDYSGNWSAPYKKAGYNVIRHDLKRGWDIFSDTLPAVIADSLNGVTVHGILAAPPCTDFSNVGAQYWHAKDTTRPDYNSRDIEFDSQTEMSCFMIYTVMYIVELLKPKFWALENPLGRLRKLVPELGKPKLTFQPYEFGELYSKRTCLWGEFNPNLRRNPALPLYGNIIDMHRSAERRSVTPRGFTQAFYEANQ